MTRSLVVLPLVLALEGAAPPPPAIESGLLEQTRVELLLV